MEEQVDLLGVQLMHMVDVMDRKLDRIKLNQEHLKQMTPNERGQVNQRLIDIEKQEGAESV